MSLLKINFISFFIASTLSFCVVASDSLKKSTSNEISIGNMSFSVSNLTVKKGETIQWINNDLVPHTVTALDKSFDSQTIAPGKTWTFRAKKIGQFPYQCEFHPSMKASVSVE